MKLKYPDRLDIPTTYHINSAVTSYRGAVKDNEKEGNVEYEDVAEGNVSQKEQYIMPLRYVQCLESILHGNMNISEASTRRVLIRAFNLNEDSLPTYFQSTERIISRATTFRSNILGSRGWSSY